MLFNSYIFWLFFAAVIILNRLLAHRGQNRMLLIASYVFYGYWDWRFLFLILGSTLIDYFVANRIDESEDHKVRKKWLYVSLAANLGTLGFFKYFGFFAHELTSLLNAVGLQVSPLELNILLPVGISFYTFQTLSYTIDVYRKQLKPTNNFWNFSLYVSFFPQLVAGPIERSSRLMPQITAPRKPGADDFRIGLYHILLGLFMKVVIADNMAVFVDTVFDTPSSEMSALLCLTGVYAFAFQIYGDFAGYTSIARGVARWLGFDLMVNFNHPYFSRSPTELWRRWHISLSTWLRDYIFIPLTTGKFDFWTICRNLFITMLLGGLWHGANWTFVLWGAFHGIWLCVDMWIKRRHQTSSMGTKKPLSKIRVMGQILITFHLVCFGYLLFRAKSIGQAWDFMTTFFTNWQSSALATTGLGLMFFYVAPLLIYEFWVERKGDPLILIKSHWLLRACIYSYLVLMILFFHAPIRAQFIYFQF